MSTKSRERLFGTTIRMSAECAQHVRKQADQLARHQHPQHLIAALARLAQIGEPMPRSLQQLRRVRA